MMTDYDLHGSVSIFAREPSLLDLLFLTSLACFFRAEKLLNNNKKLNDPIVRLKPKFNNTIKLGFYVVFKERG